MGNPSQKSISVVGMSSFRPDFFFDSQTWVSIRGSKAEKSPFLTDPDPDPSEVADGVPKILEFPSGNRLFCRIFEVTWGSPSLFLGVF